MPTATTRARIVLALWLSLVAVLAVGVAAQEVSPNTSEYSAEDVRTSRGLARFWRRVTADTPTAPAQLAVAPTTTAPTTAPPTTAAPTTAAPTTAPPTTAAPTTAPPTTAAPAPLPAAPVGTASFLAANVPGALHEARPHGVPAGYDWSSRAIFNSLNPPTGDSGYVNLWGQIYTDETNAHPANTRVAIADCEFWRLAPTGTTWVRLQGSAAVEGGAWSEDYTRSGGPFNIRTEADGSQSMVPANGYNAHFWTRASLVNAGSGSRAFVVACSTRLVLNNPTGPDDRAAARYVVSVGADWRRSDYGCPSVNGTTICTSIGIGRFIRVTNDWRRVVFSTMSSTTAASLPPLPADILTNPNGTFG